MNRKSWFLLALAVCLMANGGLKALMLPDPAKLMVTGGVVRIRHDDNVPVGHNAGALAVKAAVAYIYGVRLTERQVASSLSKSGQSSAAILAANVAMGDYYTFPLNLVERLALPTSAARQSVLRWLNAQAVPESLSSVPTWKALFDLWPFALLGLCFMAICGHMTSVQNPKLYVRLSSPREKRYRRLAWLVAKFYAGSYLRAELGFESDAQACLMLRRAKSSRETARTVRYVATVWLSAWHYQGLNKWRPIEEEAAELVVESRQNALVKKAPFVIVDIIIRPLPA